MSSVEKEMQADKVNSEEESKGEEIPKGEKSPEKTNGPTLRDRFNRLLHWDHFSSVGAGIVASADIYLFFTQGIRTAISALAAEGTLALALVTYIQMKLAQQRYPP